MSSSIDRILDSIDAGLQSSSEVGMSVWAGHCVRCLDELDVINDTLCADCRAFLLEDTEHDPASSGATTSGRASAAAEEWGRQYHDAVVIAWRSQLATFCEGFTSVEEFAAAEMRMTIHDLRQEYPEP